MRVAVIGGGISGLTAAHLLVAAGHDVALVDDAAEPGGLIAGARVDGFLCERGPQAVLDGSEAVRALIASAGLEGRIVRALPASRRRSVYVAGKLRPFPASPPALIKTNLLSARGKLRLLREPFVRRRESNDANDESVFDFVARRFGPEAAQRAAGPALIGVYAGDAAALSVRAALPRLAALEREHGSVLRGLFRARGTSRLGRPVTFPEGLGELPGALGAALAARRRTARATGLERREGKWTVVLDAGTTLEAERVVLATPAAAAAALLAPHAAGAAEALRAIPHAPVAVVCLGFRAADPGALGMDLDAYGFVVARGEGISLLGCQYDSSVFPGRAPAGGVLLRALCGGMFDPELVDTDDATITGRVLGDLRRAAGLRREPDVVQVWRARPGIPQYDSAHLARLRAVDEALMRLPGLSAIGQALRGVGVSACVGAATALVRDIGA
ncbi:MAG TPA: protoporphyrinogen oxidase [Polyangia bacterium]|nr:protoporphyrinogen oxidase [Polyangia bacterium]